MEVLHNMFDMPLFQYLCNSQRLCTVESSYYHLKMGKTHDFVPLKCEIFSIFLQVVKVFKICYF